MKNALLALCLVGCSTWSRQDTIAYSTFVASTWVDMFQTADSILPKCAELNPIIGPCGERVPIVVYVPVVDAAVLGAAVLMPPKWRTAFLSAMAGLELGIIWNNHANKY